MGSGGGQFSHNCPMQWPQVHWFGCMLECFFFVLLTCKCTHELQTPSLSVIVIPLSEKRLKLLPRIDVLGFALAFSDRLRSHSLSAPAGFWLAASCWYLELGRRLQTGCRCCWSGGCSYELWSWRTVVHCTSIEEHCSARVWGWEDTRGKWLCRQMVWNCLKSVQMRRTRIGRRTSRLSTLHICLPTDLKCAQRIKFRGTGLSYCAAWTETFTKKEGLWMQLLCASKCQVQGCPGREHWFYRQSRWRLQWLVCRLGFAAWEFAWHHSTFRPLGGWFWVMFKDVQSLKVARLAFRKRPGKGPWLCAHGFLATTTFRC